MQCKYNSYPEARLCRHCCSAILILHNIQPDVGKEIISRRLFDDTVSVHYTDMPPTLKILFFNIHIDKLFNIVISVELHLLIQWQIDKKN